MVKADVMDGATKIGDKYTYTYKEDQIEFVRFSNYTEKVSNANKNLEVFYHID